MKTTKIVWDNAQLDFLLKQRAGAVGRDLEDRASRVMWAAKAQSGLRTGALRLSIHMIHKREATGQAFHVGSPLNYALAHHEGSRPHVIVAKPPGKLKFTKKGATIFAHAVVHPGTRPNKFLTDNLVLVLAPGLKTPGAVRIIDV